MPDQKTTPVHQCIDGEARVRVTNLERQRQEDRSEVADAMRTMGETVKGMDKKLDNIQRNQADHGTQIAVLTTRIDHIASAPFSPPGPPPTAEIPTIDRRPAGPIGDIWSTVPPWVRALVYLIAGALGTGGGMSLFRPGAEPASQGDDAPKEATHETDHRSTPAPFGL